MLTFLGIGTGEWRRGYLGVTSLLKRKDVALLYRNASSGLSEQPFEIA